MFVPLILPRLILWATIWPKFDNAAAITVSYVSSIGASLNVALVLSLSGFWNLTGSPFIFTVLMANYFFVFSSNKVICPSFAVNWMHLMSSALTCSRSSFNVSSSVNLPTLVVWKQRVNGLWSFVIVFS